MLMPGLGQIYNGELRKGALFATSLVLLSFIQLISSLGFFVFITSMLLILFVWIWSMIDAALVSKKLNSIEANSSRSWLALIIYLIVGRGLSLGLYFIVTTYYGSWFFFVPNNMMAPTVLKGDYIVVVPNYYKNKHLEQDDVVVFLDDNGKKHLGRVIAKSKDSVAIKSNSIEVDGEVVFHQLIPTLGLDKKETFLFSNECILVHDNPNIPLMFKVYGEVKTERILGKVLYVSYSELGFKRWGLSVE